MDEELKQHIEELKLMMTPEKIGRKIARGVVKHSVGFVASQLAKTYVPTENKKQQLQVRLGAYAIGAMAGDAAADWAEQQFNEIVDFIKKVVEGVKKRDDAADEEPPILHAVAAE